jgi:hypothetical protein
MSDELRQRIDAARSHVDLIALVNADTDLRKVGNSWRGICPFHGRAGSGRNFIVYTSTDGIQRARCKSQGCFAGDAVDYVQAKRLANASVLDALTWLDGKRGDWYSERPRVYQPTPTPPVPPGLGRQALAYHLALDTLMTPQGGSGRDWWHDQGLDDETIARYEVGICPRCPTASHDEPDARSATIPILRDGQIVQIRHRLLQPADPKDKYRPEVRGQGLLLFNTDSLTKLPDGEPRDGMDDVLIVEGEKKTLVLERFGLGWLLPVISATGGIDSWASAHAEQWLPLLDSAKRVHVCFDPGMASRAAAEKTARLFGRRGCIMSLPDKIDDWLLATYQAGDQLAPMQYMITKLGNALPAGVRQILWED